MDHPVGAYCRLATAARHYFVVVSQHPFRAVGRYLGAGALVEVIPDVPWLAFV